MPAADLGVERLLRLVRFEAHAAGHGFADGPRGAHLVNERGDLAERRLFAHRRVVLRDGFRRRRLQLPQPKLAKQAGAAELVTAVDLAVDGEDIAEKRRSYNPSLKRPESLVAPEQKFRQR